MVRLHVDENTRAIRGFTSHPVKPGDPFVTDESIDKDLLKRGVLYFEGGKVVVRESMPFAKVSAFKSGAHDQHRRMSPQRFINDLLAFDGTVDDFVALHRCP